MAERYSVSFDIRSEENRGPVLLHQVGKTFRDWADSWFLKLDDSLRSSDLEEPKHDYDDYGDLAFHSTNWIAPNRRSLDIKLATEGNNVEAQIQVRDVEDSSENAPTRAPMGLADVFESFDCYVGSERIKSKPQILSLDDAQQFANDVLLNEERNIAVVVVTVWQDSMLVDPAKLQDRLLGLAHVACYDERSAGPINRLLGHIPCYGGAVRVYPPHLELTTSSRCPFWPRWQDVDLLKDPRIWEACTLHAPIGTEGRLYEGVSSEIRKLRRVQDLQRIHSEQEIENLRLVIQERDRQIGLLEHGLQKSQEDLRSLDEDYRKLRSRNWWLKDQLEGYGGKEFASEETPEFHTVLDVVNHAAETLGCIKFLGSAVETASKSPFRRPYDVWNVVSAMEQCAALRLTDGLGVNVEEWFKGLGIEFAPTESKSTREQYGAERVIEGKDMSAHFKLGSGTSDQQNYLRIHVYWNKDEGEWVVGHIGPHLRTDSSG